MQRKKPQHKSIFYPVLSGFVLLSLIGITVTLVHLWHYLEDYQDTLPSQIGETVYHAYQACDTPTLRSLCTNLPDALQDDFTYQSYLHQVIDPKTLYYYESNRDDVQGTITYSYMTKGQDFATLTVHKTAETSPHGFPRYEAGSLEQYSLVSYEFHEAVGTRISIEGKPIDASYLVSQNAVASAFDEIDFGPFYDTVYAIPDDIALGEITANDVNGSPCDITWDAHHQICTSSQKSEALLHSSVADFGLQSAKTYATFATLKNISRESLLSILYPDTSFYQAVKSYDNAWGIAATADSFSNERINDCRQYSEHAYTCDVSFDYTVTQGNQEKVFPLHFLCYIVVQDGICQLLTLETL